MKALIWFLTLAAFAFAEPQSGIEVIHVRGNVYMFASDEGNITVQVGEYRDNDGMLMVDTGSTSMTERVQAELGEACGGLGPDAGHERGRGAGKARAGLLTREHDEAGGLLGVGGNLGDELVGADSDRAGQLGGRLDLGE